MYFKTDEHEIDIANQSTEIPNSGGVRQSTLVPLGVTLEYDFDDAKTVVEVLCRGRKVSNNGPCLGWRDSNPAYKWLSYAEVIERSTNISYGLVHAGMKKGQESRVGIYSRNCVEWVLVEQACFRQSAVLVPLYDTLGPAACKFILNLVEAEFLVCDTDEKVKNILDAKEDIPKLNHIVVFEEVSSELRALASNKGVTILQLGSLEEAGKRKPESVMLPEPSDLATICFTSGSTGDPKGVMLTHGNLVIIAKAISRHLDNYLTSADVHLSYLPLAHVFDRFIQVLMYLNGGSVGFWRGDMKLLLEDLRALKPTVFIAVPRILNKIYDEIQKDFKSNTVKAMQLNIALRVKQAELERGIIRNNSFSDKLVLGKIRDFFGGKVRLLITGAAPIRKEVFSFFKFSMGCYVVNGYGLTETTGTSNVSVPGDYNVEPGIVGPPFPGVLMKLKDVPEKGYYACNGEGEILIKGPTVMKGYFKDPVRTAEVIDGEGWVHTGDIGRWTENGALAVIDRKKNLLKLSQGEYISPEKVEGVYMACPYVEQIFVHGDSVEDFLVAVISLHKELLTVWCSERGIGGDWDEICESEVVKNHILKELSELGKTAGLKTFEQVKVVHLHNDGFSLDILTPTMKIKREACRRTFEEVIQDMYRGMREKT